MATASQWHSVIRLLVKYQYPLWAFPEAHCLLEEGGEKPGTPVPLPTCELNDHLSFWSILPPVLCIYQHIAIEPTPSPCLAVLPKLPCTGRMCHLFTYRTMSPQWARCGSNPDRITELEKVPCCPLARKDWFWKATTKGDSWSDRPTGKTTLRL